MSAEIANRRDVAFPLCEGPDEPQLAGLLYKAGRRSAVFTVLSDAGVHCGKLQAARCWYAWELRKSAAPYTPLRSLDDSTLAVQADGLDRS